MNSKAYHPAHGGYLGTVLVHQEVKPPHPMTDGWEQMQNGYNTYTSRLPYSEWTKERRAIAVAIEKMKSKP